MTPDTRPTQGPAPPPPHETGTLPPSELLARASPTASHAPERPSLAAAAMHVRPFSASALAAALRTAAADCAARGLLHAAKWATEHVASLDRDYVLPPGDAAPQETPLDPHRNHSHDRPHDAAAATATAQDEDAQDVAEHTRAASEETRLALQLPVPAPLPASVLVTPEPGSAEGDRIALAQSYLALRDLPRATWSVRHAVSCLGVFLRLYMTFLRGQETSRARTARRQAERTARATRDQRAGHGHGAGAAAAHGHRLDGESEPAVFMGQFRHDDENAHLNGAMGDDYLDELAAELRGLRASGRCDGFLLYLYGMVQARQLQREEAIATLLESIRYYPFNWSAWLELAECMRDRAHASAVYTTRLTPHLLTTHFLVQLSLDFNLDWETFEQALKRLLNVFPTSLQLKAQYALALYNGRAFEQAEATFEEITEQDPHSLEHMDTFSNVLYVLQKAERLALLAHHVMRIDPYQVQSCIVAGNYHSLKSDHDVAIRAFRRATQLDPQCFQAWTLMGHEFIELKQPHQAVLAYRRGLAINARDYRAWYGLGQTYEVLRLPFYALFYYQQAAALRPYDTRMWCALGECYLLVGKDSDAITCFKHALRGDDHQGHLALSALGRLYAKHGRRAQALDAFRTLLESCPPQHRVGEGYDFAAVYLARALAEQGHLRQAQELLEPVAGEEGRALKREIVRQLNQA